MFENLTWIRQHDCVFFCSYTLMHRCRGEVSGELGLMRVEVLSSKYDRKSEGKRVEAVVGKSCMDSKLGEQGSEHKRIVKNNVYKRY